MSRLKDAQMNFIIEEATKLFIQKSISSVTISDIAKEIGVGEATLYRYFGKKENIVLRSAETLSSSLLKDYFSFDENKNGYELIKDFYEAYLKIFIEKKEYYSFVNSLDAFLHNEDKSELNIYEDIISQFKKKYLEFYKKGIGDNSLVDNIDLDVFYRTTTISLLSFCKKLASGAILNEDNNFNAQREIEELINLFLYRIKKN